MSGDALGEYAIGTRISAGDYGTLHRCVGPRGEDAFALVVTGALARHPSFEAALRAAAEELEGFWHPRVAATHRVGRDPSDRLVVITEAIEEPVTLASALGAGGRPPPGIAMALSRELAEALAGAQHAGLIHGALHPRSIFVNREGQLVVADFAVGRALVETAAAEDTTLADPLRPYLAPEVELAGPPSPASDLYGAGAILFELWTGRPPPAFGDGGGPAAMRQIFEESLVSDPTARFGSAGALEQALAAAAKEGGILAVPPWQVAAWVREHVEARVRGAEAHLRPRRESGRVPDPAAPPRDRDLARAAARARGAGREAAAKTPTPIAGADAGLWAETSEEALGRVDAALSTYEPGAGGEASGPAPLPGSGERGRRLRAGDVIAVAVAIVAVVVAIAALFGAFSGGGDESPGARDESRLPQGAPAAREIG